MKFGRLKQGQTIRFFQTVYRICCIIAALPQHVCRLTIVIE